MKRLCFILILFTATSVNGFSQLTDEQSIQKTVEQMAAALKSNDAAALDKLYANDYTSVSTRGFLITKTSRLESIRSGRLKFKSYDYGDVKVRLYGNTAVVNLTIRMCIKGEEDNTVLATLVLTKNGEQWQIVNAQATNIVQ